MRILVVGAGATGGYFGGRLAEAGQDVTFLVRPRRRAELAANGLVIRSFAGDVHIAQPKTVLAEELHEPFELILLSSKAYDLEGAMESFAPAVGPQTMILPVLNGMQHTEKLDARFGREHVLGGLCVISAALQPGGTIAHLNNLHAFTYGERDGKRTARVERIEQAFAGAKFDSKLNDNIMQAMWEKWVFIATCAAITCLMRGTIGDIVAGGATDLGLAMLAESAAVATAQGFAPREHAMAQNHAILTAPGSGLAASMMRDLESGAQVEADQIIGDLLRRGEGVPCPMLGVAYAGLKVYQARRERESAKA